MEENPSKIPDQWKQVVKDVNDEKWTCLLCINKPFSEQKTLENHYYLEHSRKDLAVILAKMDHVLKPASVLATTECVVHSPHPLISQLHCDDNKDELSGSSATVDKPKSSHDKEKLLQTRDDEENQETQFILIEGAPPQVCSSDVFDFVCQETDLNATWVNVICGDNEYCNGRVVCLFYDSKEATQAAPSLDKKLLMGSKISVQLLSVSDMHRLNAAFPEIARVQRGKECTTKSFGKKDCVIVLGNLPYGTGKEDICQHIEKTLEISIDKDNINMYSDKCNGTVQLVLDSEEEAIFAQNKLQDSWFLNRVIRTYKLQ